MTDRVHRVLTRPRQIAARIRGVLSEEEGLRMAMLPGAVQYDGVSVTSTPDSDPMSTYAARLDELERKRLDLLEDYLAAQDVIVRITDQLVRQDPIDGGDQALAVKLRYLSGYDFESIAKEMHVSDSTMFRRYRAGLDALDQIILDDATIDSE